MLVPRLTLAACSLLIAFTAYAGEAEDIQQLLKARQFPQALERADKALSKTPKDAQIRFLRGISLTELGRSEDAIKVFSKLSEDYPHLPEPYNNLAVLYASSNQFDKARSALQMSIQTNPSYAIAHENMGDLYARLASQAYDKALQLENSNSQVQTKLKLVGSLFNPAAAKSVAATKPVTVAAVVPPAPVKAPPKLVTPQPTLPPTPIKATAAPSAVPTQIKATPTPTAVQKATVTPRVTETPKATPTPVPERNSDKQQVIASVESWASVWSKQNVAGYINSYAADFKAPGGRSAWEKDRQAKIAGPKSIDVQVNQIKVEFIDDNTAKVRLRQAYKSDRLSSRTTGKTLIMQKAGNRWLILEERIGG